jgi:hypothetical protein
MFDGLYKQMGGILMKCPYCNVEMTKGKIIGNQYKLKWLPENRRLFMGIWAFGGIKLGQGGLLSRAKVKSFMCHACNKIILDTNKA